MTNENNMTSSTLGLLPWLLPRPASIAGTRYMQLLAKTIIVYKITTFLTVRSGRDHYQYFSWDIYRKAWMKLLASDRGILAAWAHTDGLICFSSAPTLQPMHIKICKNCKLIWKLYIVTDPGSSPDAAYFF